jgi:hypothetical protein
MVGRPPTICEMMSSALRLRARPLPGFFAYGPFFSRARAVGRPPALSQPLALEISDTLTGPSTPVPAIAVGRSHPPSAEGGGGPRPRDVGKAVARSPAALSTCHQADFFVSHPSALLFLPDHHRGLLRPLFPCLCPSLPLLLATLSPRRNPPWLCWENPPPTTASPQTARTRHRSTAPWQATRLPNATSRAISCSRWPPR